jgi:hypothetical protein
LVKFDICIDVFPFGGLYQLALPSDVVGFSEKDVGQTRSVAGTNAHLLRISGSNRCRIGLLGAVLASIPPTAQGKSPHAAAAGQMPWKPIGRMGDEELRAIQEYLTHLPNE